MCGSSRTQIAEASGKWNEAERAAEEAERVRTRVVARDCRRAREMNADIIVERSSSESSGPRDRPEGSSNTARRSVDNRVLGGMDPVR